MISVLAIVLTLVWISVSWWLLAWPTDALFLQVKPYLYKSCGASNTRFSTEATFQPKVPCSAVFPQLSKDQGKLSCWRMYNHWLQQAVSLQSTWWCQCSRLYNNGADIWVKQHYNSTEYWGGSNCTAVDQRKRQVLATKCIHNTWKALNEENEFDELLRGLTWSTRPMRRLQLRAASPAPKVPTLLQRPTSWAGIFFGESIDFSGT